MGERKRLHQIKASAGSGKTWTLTRAFLELLQKSEPNPAGGQAQACLTKVNGACSPESIIAITFTNAAATEMRERILGDLKKAVLGRKEAPPISSVEAEKWLQHILKRPNALNVRTIDSLLHLIVRSAALSLGIPPDYQPVFSTPEMMANALNLLLEIARQEGDSLHGQNDLPGSTHTLLYKAFDALVTYGNSTGFLAGDKIEQDLSILLDDLLGGRFDGLSDCSSVEARYNHIKEACRQTANTLLLSAPEKDFNSHAWKFLNNLKNGNFAKAEESSYINYTDRAKFFLKKAVVTSQMDEAFTSFVQASTLYGEQGQLLKLALKTAPFVNLGRRLQEVFAQSPDAYKHLPNSRISGYVEALLSADQGVPEALCRLGTRLTHYLIDEFQDTSLEQWKALAPLVHEAISSGGTFTWVGDVKQSIYSWRGGDASLFDGILSLPPLNNMGDACKENLPFNRRSLANVVAFNNQLFGPLANEQKAALVLDQILPGTMSMATALATPRIAMTFANCHQDMPDVRSKDRNKGLVSIVPVDEENLYDCLTDKIHEAHKIRPWSDMLVLVPFHRIATSVAEAMIQAGIPVVTENSLLLGKHSLIVQTVALLQFLLNPADEIALWTAMTGSMTAQLRKEHGIEDAALPDWCACRDRSQPLGLQIAKTWPAFWDACFEHMQQLAQKYPPYDLVVEWYAKTQALSRFPGAALFLRRFLEILFLAEQKGALSLGAFLELWSGEHAEEKVPMPESMDAVRIMTIHKSKGLEKAVVFVPWTKMEAKARSFVVTKKVGDLNVAVPLKKIVEPEYSEDMARSACELLHLLYVAFTRARDALYIFHNEENKAFQSLLEIAHIPNDYTQGEIPQSKSSAKAHTAEAQDEIRSECDYWDLAENDGQGIKIFRNIVPSRLLARERGDFLHFCLEHLKPETLQTTPRHAAEQTLQQGMQHYRGAFSGHVAENVTEQQSLLKALEWFISQPEVADWFEAGIPEISLTDKEGQIHRVDMLVCGNKSALILEYKSGTVKEEHISQVRNYLQLLSHENCHMGKPLALLVYLDLQKFCLVSPQQASPLCNHFKQCCVYLGI